MTGGIKRSGECTITYNPSNGDMLLSPDKQQHLIPCEGCGQPEWQPLNVVAAFCDECWGEMKKDKLGGK